MRDSTDIIAAMLAYLKAQNSLVSLLTSGDAGQIKEDHWQGTEFTFPAIRLAVDWFPSINGCGLDKADWIIEVFSESKSSKDANDISGTITKILHKHPFVSNGIKFPVVVVTKVVKAERSLYGWKSQINLTTQFV